MAKKLNTTKQPVFVTENKALKVSRIAAKIALRLFLILMLIVMVPYFMGDGLDKQLSHIYIVMTNKWLLVCPAVIIMGFVALLITSTVQKYSKPDVNWLFVVNTFVLIACGIAIYIKILRLIH